MTAPRPTCVHCGARYGARNTTEVRVEWSAGEPMPEYRGNGRLVRRKIGRNKPELHARAFGWFELWDGETWRKPYEPFCTLRCALEYARKTYRMLSVDNKRENR